MADNLVSQDPTKPGVLKANGTPLATNGKLPLSGLDPTGAADGQVVVRTGGVWVAGSGGASSDTASNLGAGHGVFSSKVGGDFQFKSLVAGSNTTITPAATTLTIASTATGPFSASFVSTDQVITAAGALTLAHGLAGIPTLLQIRVRSTTAEHGYSIGDELMMHFGSQENTLSTGIAVVPDATNVVIRYGSTGTVFYILNKTTGTVAALTPANWVLIVRAWR